MIFYYLVAACFLGHPVYTSGFFAMVYKVRKTDFTAAHVNCYETRT